MSSVDVYNRMAMKETVRSVLGANLWDKYAQSAAGEAMESLKEACSDFRTHQAGGGSRHAILPL
jgi:hypothetical protein